MLALNPDDQRSLAWLCEMAALGCLHNNRSAWAAQLRDDARLLRQEANRAEGRSAKDIIGDPLYE